MTTTTITVFPLVYNSGNDLHCFLLFHIKRLSTTATTTTTNNDNNNNNNNNNNDDNNNTS